MYWLSSKVIYLFKSYYFYFLINLFSQDSSAEPEQYLALISKWEDMLMNVLNTSVSGSNVQIVATLEESNTPVTGLKLNRRHVEIGQRNRKSINRSKIIFSDFIKENFSSYKNDTWTRLWLTSTSEREKLGVILYSYKEQVD